MRSVRLEDDARVVYPGVTMPDIIFRFDEEDRKDVDITEEEPGVFQRLTAWEDAWRETVKRDQTVYTVKRR